MNTIIPFQQQIRRAMNEAFARIDSKSVVMHTDLLRMMLFQRGISFQDQIADLFHALVETSSGRTMLFPTFNNNFFRSGIYNPLTDICEVGALNEYVRQLYPAQRTLTPACSFCIYNNHTFLLDAVENVFSKESTFGECVKYNASVFFLGAVFNANTFIHHVEEVMDVGYRYIKLFPGVIQVNGTSQRIVLHYRVRPRSGSVDYDWDRLALDLIDQKILHQVPLGKGKLSWYNARRLMEYWSNCMAKDEMYLLTPESRAKTQELYARYGKPLRYEVIEKPQQI